MGHVAFGFGRIGLVGQGRVIKVAQAVLGAQASKELGQIQIGVFLRFFASPFVG